MMTMRISASPAKSTAPPGKTAGIIALAFLLPLFACLRAHAADITKIAYGRFGEVTVYRQVRDPQNVVLFVSGDGGWNSGVIDMAQSLVELDSVVIGINIVHYLHEVAGSGESCTYSAADFENLSHFVQKKIGLPRYIPPVLVGYSSGATLVYAVLAQAPAGTYQGGLSLGFCPDLPINKPFCPGSADLQCEPGQKGKGYILLPARQLKAKWIALQGDIDQVCDPAAAEKFVSRISTAAIVKLPKVGHGFAVPKNWLPQFKQAFADLHDDQDEAREPPGLRQDISDLPVHEVPAAGGPGSTMAVIYTGDGGWAGIDRELARALSAAGLSVVGLDTLQYFWTPRTPENAARDLERLLKYYQETWHYDNVVLIGYSLGAEVLPFLADRLADPWRHKIRLIGLLSPGDTASFEFHLSDWLGGKNSSEAKPVKPEIEKLYGDNLICFYGSDEKDALCQKLDGNRVKIIALAGGHHFGGKYDVIAGHLLRALEEKVKLVRETMP